MANTNGFSSLVRATSPKVRAFVQRRISVAHDVEDVVAETFLVAWRRYDDVPPGPGALPWLYRVAHFAIANSNRGHRRRTALVNRAAFDATVSRPHRVAIASLEERDVLLQAFDQLSVADQDVLLLAAWEGLGPEQLAIALDCAPGTATTRLSRARTRFGAAIHQIENESPA